MALTSSYLVTTKNLESIINSVINAKAPDRFTNKFLEDLGYKSSNDRLITGVFKSLGLLDESSQPTQRYYEFLDQTQTAIILAQGIQEAYEDLFNLRKDAQSLTYDEVKNKLKTLTQGQKSEKVVGLMANTFKALSDLADWSQPTNKKETSQPVEKKQPNEDKKTEKNVPLNQMPVAKPGIKLHYNIQIILPETTNMVVYDAIFQSLNKHLLQ